jgi:hypothetical protein
MEVSLVPPELAEGLWPRIFPHLSRAAEYTFGRYEPEDIFDAVLSGQIHLWIVIDGDEIIGITATRFWQYPRKKCLDMVFIAGDEGLSWKDAMLSVLQHWAYDNGCEVIESSGRPGFSRALKDDGYRLLWQVYELPVAEAGLGGRDG